MFDLVGKYWRYLDRDNDKNLSLSLLLHYLENYVNGAIIEMNRLEKTRRKLDRLGDADSWRPEKQHFQLTSLACDTHFFFICIDKCYKLINQLSIELNDEDIKKLKTKLNKIFDIKTVRNHLEHIDDRCKGYLSLKNKKQNIKTHISDFANFAGDDFSFNNKKFPSNKKSLEELKVIYRDLIKIIHNKYAIKDAEFVEEINMEKSIKLIKKALKKAGLI